MKGQVIRSEICGAIKMKVYLTGMPELRLGLNDKILFENTGSKIFYVITNCQYAAELCNMHVYKLIVSIQLYCVICMCINLSNV